MREALAEQLAYLPDYLSRHLQLTLFALGIGMVVSFPIAVLASRSKRLEAPVLAVASVFQTIPGLALLALMVPLLNQIGFVPAAVGLILYSMLPILRNTVTGLRGVDADIIEAARGIGMTENQILFRIQFPLAMPVIVAGIRTATVWVVGMATLSTPVGATSLGNYIFQGLQIQNYYAVTVGCVAAATLALVLDGLIRLIERAAEHRNRTMAIASAVALLLVIGGGLSPAVTGAFSTDRQSQILIGSKSFTEQYILGEVIASQFDDAGLSARHLDSLGSSVVFDALVSGRIDCYVDYSGTIWANYMNHSDNPGPQEMLTKVTEWLADEHNVTTAGALGFENTYALAMPRAAAEKRSINTVHDLAAYAPELTIGADYEFFGRPEWASLRDAYGLDFDKQVQMDSALMYSGVIEGKVDVISAYTTDGRITEYDLKILDDPLNALPPYDALVLVSEEAANMAPLREALAPLIGAIDNQLMRRANKRVDIDNWPVRRAAAELRAAVRDADGGPSPRQDTAR